jgi:hypothetical protein
MSHPPAVVSGWRMAQSYDRFEIDNSQYEP